NIPVGSINISGTFLNKGSKSISSFDVNYSINSGSVVTETINATSIIASGSSYLFTLTNATSFATSGEMDTLRIWATNLDGNTD
ncbi:hypothetical protein LI003_23240, partial [Bacteroides caccae]|uniref:hypothetical protein n=1 Tax=Bacteroides caccae TaxID=47678 RepID=UPI001D06C7E0